MTRLRGRALLLDAHAHGFAVPAFNVSNLETAPGRAARPRDRPQPRSSCSSAPGAIAYAGYGPLTRLVMDLAEAAAVPVVVHLDHCREPDIVARAIERRLRFGHVRRLAPGLRRQRRRDVPARGARSRAEPGHRGRGGARASSAAGRTPSPEAARASRTTPDEAARFVAATDIDVIAPNLGNLHRMPDDSTELDLEQIRAIAAATDRPIALHGGSGIDQAQLSAAIAAGIGKVNISSRVTRALAAGIRSTWAADPDQLDLRRFLGAGREIRPGDGGRATSS